MKPFTKFNKWVHRHPAPHYTPRDVADNPTTVQPVVLQVEDEIRAFVEVLSKETRRESALEVGLFRGSTHYLWRLLYGTVASVEFTPLFIGMFVGEFIHGNRLPKKGASIILHGDSRDPATVKAAQSHFPAGLDLLFIDGNHEYDTVMSDYTLYSPLVRSGGIVAFHDILSMETGVPRFIAELERTQPLHKIIASNHLGIAWYRKVSI